MTKGEKKIYQILQRYRGEIKDIELEKTFKDLKYKGTPLRFDFYIKTPQGPVLIEYDGEQHYKFNKFFHKDQSTFKHMMENDRRKNKFALQNNIPLYRISCYDMDKINTAKDIFQPQYRVKDIYHNDNIRFKLNN